MPRRLLTGIGLTAIGVAAVIGALLWFTSRENATTGVTSGVPGTAAPQVASEDLRAGNVVLRAEPAQLDQARAVAEELAGPPDDALRDAGQAVLVRRQDAAGVTAQAWHRELQAPTAGDPAVQDFIDYWLGRGAGG